jgi:hypothetical protein
MRHPHRRRVRDGDGLTPREIEVWFQRVSEYRVKKKLKRVFLPTVRVEYEIALDLGYVLDEPMGTA